LAAVAIVLAKLMPSLPAALRPLDSIAGSGALDGYAPFHLARADMFRRLGRSGDAREWYRRALPFAQNEQVRRFIERRLSAG
jgi:RNA polymerase sigma-70 factor (ECF subfamily)